MKYSFLKSILTTLLLVGLFSVCANANALKGQKWYLSKIKGAISRIFGL